MKRVPFLIIFGAVGLVGALKGIKRLRRGSLLRSPQKTTAVVTLGFVLMGATLFPSTAALWGPGFPASAAMEPLKQAGGYVSNLPLPGGERPSCEPPVTASFCGYAP